MTRDMPILIKQYHIMNFGERFLFHQLLSTIVCASRTFYYILGLLWGDKTLCEILAAANAIPLPMAGSRVDDNLSRHGSVRQFLQRDSNRTWSRSFGVLDLAHG